MEDKQLLISKEIHQTLKILAAKRGVSIKEVITQVLEDYLKSIKKGDR